MSKRGILYGFPVLIDEQTDSVTPANWFAGIALDFMCSALGFNGAILEYEEGDYWGALWSWLTGEAHND